MLCYTNEVIESGFVDWLQKHRISWTEIIEALKACTLRLPIIGKLWWSEKMSGDELEIVRNAGVVLLQREISDSINIQSPKVRIKFMVAGGTESSIDPLSVAGFSSPDQELCRLSIIHHRKKLNGLLIVAGMDRGRLMGYSIGGKTLKSSPTIVFLEINSSDFLVINNRNLSMQKDVEQKFKLGFVDMGYQLMYTQPPEDGNGAVLTISHMPLLA
ncbi:hypothetical protein Bca52824_002368 [Brassica carinata]|uniref:Uncharacterized protein n=1 Tax=Brassica carinata TaxID=52824 RepID=A0A8X7WHS5_BRACI|nr:hypothetical protein Bca52824_002368 [Brassica carinata]